MGTMQSNYSVRSADLANREKYLASGGKNENYYGYGLEDAEQRERLEIMNLSVHCIYGPLFHLWHPRRKLSWYTDKIIEIQNTKEFIETCRKNEIN